MKATRETLIGLITSAIQESVPSASPDSESALIGAGRIVDSIGLVTMLVGVEQRAASELGQAVSLMDERAMSQTKSPFRTVGTLADYLLELLGDGSDSN